MNCIHVNHKSCVWMLLDKYICFSQVIYQSRLFPALLFPGQKWFTGEKRDRYYVFFLLFSCSSSLSSSPSFFIKDLSWGRGSLKLRVRCLQLSVSQPSVVFLALFGIWKREKPGLALQSSPRVLCFFTFAGDVDVRHELILVFVLSLMFIYLIYVFARHLANILSLLRCHICHEV